MVWVYGFYEVYNDVQIANRNSSPNLINDFKNWNQQNKIIAILIICAILILTLNSLISFSSTDSYPSDDSDTSNYVSYSYESPSSHYRGVDTSPDTLAKNDPDWYYDHYEYGDNPDIDDYLEYQYRALEETDGIQVIRRSDFPRHIFQPLKKWIQEDGTYLLWVTNQGKLYFNCILVVRENKIKILTTSGRYGDDWEDLEKVKKNLEKEFYDLSCHVIIKDGNF